MAFISTPPAIFIDRTKEKLIPFLQSANLAILTACSIEKILGRHPSTPIYVPHNQNIASWPEAHEDGNLIVDLSVQLQSVEAFQHKISPGQIVLINVSYRRQRIPDSLYSGSGPHQYFASAFTYTEDRKNLQILLTDALHLCLDKPYWANGR